MSTSAEAEGRAAARRRHPCTQAPVPAGRVAERMARALADAGAPWPDVGARVLEARGRTGLDLVAFARQVGVSTEVMRRAEAGEVAFALLPPAVRLALVR